MLSHEITAIAGKYKARKRIGRGQGSGHGKTAGRGHKGQKSRAGYSRKHVYEGGQMPLFRKLPKVGFSNFNFAHKYEIINVNQLEKFFEDGAEINVEQMVKLGLIDSTKSKVKVLGNGELTKKLNVSAHKFSKSAEQKISQCGGTAVLIA
ncbi:50S ribosomal protein L15 [Limihaloglobus sulfuriphilus]|uniref:Large ribosomal subunit protein uL15 n=1 Tax=Limihaloglobus sulfuriphilus TaxID=1851148 RepID=A0A1Q2MHN4_9BACT|nr:50S ribosomal protein L15 [Limihaloglobus sulfuriphilus]AQQ72038.1 50S ribosomal protein L15 [Limihaloglobus sulfuriphilus]